MRSHDVVCRCRLRAAAALVCGAVLLCVPAVASAADAVTSRSGFDAFMDAWNAGETATTPATVEEAPSPAPSSEPAPGSTREEVAEQPATRAESRQAASADGPDETVLSRAAPILLGLLGVAIVLLGLAALPPARRRASSLSVLVTERRLELGLAGGAALASAAIGLAVAAAAG